MSTTGTVLITEPKETQDFISLFRFLTPDLRGRLKFWLRRLEKKKYKIPQKGNIPATIDLSASI